MFRRGSPSPGFSIYDACAEFHEFEGRWFVTGRWASGSGTALRRPASDAQLGKAVLRRIQAGLRSPRPLVASLQEHSEGQRRDAAQWGLFCTRVAGVPPRRYRPEKRLVILADQAGLRCHDDRNSPEPLPDGPPAVLGAALIAMIERLEASWPTEAAAVVAHDGATMLVYPRRGNRSAAPVVRLPAGASAAAVGSAVRYAFTVSGAAGEIVSERVTAGFRAAVWEAGWTMGGLDAAARVHIRRTTIGEVFVSGANSLEDDIPVRGEGGEPVGTAVLAQLGQTTLSAPVPHARRPTGFGRKTGWIAVRGASADAVVRALGLRDVRPASWDDGIEAAYREGVFVGPPVEGWVFAAGAGILIGPVDPAGLSRQLGSQVHLFRTHRVSDAHEWTLADSGTVIRAVSYVDGEFRQAGEPTHAERALGLDHPDAIISEDEVLAVAGAWSLDPDTLHDHPSEAAAGTWGQLP